MSPSHHLNSAGYVLLLGGLVAATQQDDEGATLLRVIEPVARPIADPHFAHAFADTFHITGISMAQPPNTLEDSLFCVQVAKSSEPSIDSSEISIWII